MFTLWFKSFIDPSDWTKFEDAHNFESAKQVARRALREGVGEVQIRDTDYGHTFTYKSGDIF